MSETKKSGGFGKWLKRLLWVLVGIVGLVVVLVAIMPLWISPVATSVANCVVPKITGTAFHIEKFCVNPWTGTVRIEDVRLSNPEGFGESPAVSVKSVFVDLGLLGLFTNKFHIEDLVVEDPFASYYSHDGDNNFDKILANVDKALGSKEKKAEEAEDEEEEGEKSEMKLIIDHIRISGTKVKLTETDMVPPIPIMTIELSDIGKESDGATLEETWTAVSDAFIKGMSSVGDGLGALGGLLGGAASSTGEGAKAAAGAVSDGAKAAAGAVSDGAKAAAEGVKNLFK